MMKFGKALLLMTTSLMTLPAFANCEIHPMVCRTAVINAPLCKVWEAIKASRLNDPNRKMISSVGTEYVVSEKFDSIPMLGTVTCTYSEHEVGSKRLEYKMLSSDKFIAFEGYWLLAPCDHGQHTSVTLNAFTDTGLHIPFAAKITRGTTTEQVEKRLSGVKLLSEKQAIASS